MKLYTKTFDNSHILFELYNKHYSFDDYLEFVDGYKSLKDVVYKNHYEEIENLVSENFDIIEKYLKTNFYNSKTMKWSVKKFKSYVREKCHIIINQESFKFKLILIFKEYSKRKKNRKLLDIYINSIETIPFLNNEYFDLKKLNFENWFKKNEKLKLNSKTLESKDRLKDFYKELQEIRNKYLDVSNFKYSKFIEANIDIPNTYKTLYNIFQDKRI